MAILTGLIVGLTLGWPAHLAAAGEPFHWGNDFFLGNSSANAIINNPNTMVSIRFTANHTSTLDEIAFRTGSVASIGTPKAIVTLRADNDGLPGTILATTGAIEAPLAANANIYSAFTTSVDVTAGTTYHLVVQGVDVDASNSFTLLFSHNGGSYVNAFATGQADPAQARLTTTNSGSSWTVATQSGAGSSIAAMAARNSQTGATVGQAATSPLATASAGGTNQLVERFVYTGPDQASVNAVTLKLRNTLSGAPISGDLSVQLLDADDTLLGSALLSATSVTATAWTDYTVDFDQKITLHEDGLYKLLLLAPNAANGSYGVSTVGSTFSVGSNNAFYDGTFGGLDSYLLVSVNGGSSFVNQHPYDLYFSFSMEAIPEPGTVAYLLASGALLFIIRQRRARR